MPFINTPGRRIVYGGITQDGQPSGFPEGVDSFSPPLCVKPTKLRWAENIDLGGGFPQTRPGYKTRFTFDVNTPGSDFQLWWLAAGMPVIHPQMLASFHPSDQATPQLVFAVSGSVWWSPVNHDGSLGTATRITAFNFNPNADQLVGCACVQTSTIISGLYANNIVPRNLLIIQDGFNRAGIWDGHSAHLANPVKNVTQDADGNTLYTTGYNETRIGQWMAWSGNRLWVANGPNVYASDLNDPTHFTEELTINSKQVFTFPGNVTGLVDRGTSGTTRSQLFVFTATSTWTIWSGVQNRLPSAYGVGWAYTADMTAEIFKAVGCTGGKSIILHRGLLYWRSAAGLVLFDSTGTVNSTQNLPTIDQEMVYSTSLMSPSGLSVCAGRYGSKVFWSVPVGAVTNGRAYNGHTQMLDRQTTVVGAVSINGPFSYNTTGWCGVWTGIRPVEWVTIGDEESTEQVYALSMDQDGVVRIWEGFQANRADNGAQIPWLIETRLHLLEQSVFENCSFRHFRLLVDQIVGNLQLTGYWRGFASAYHQLLSAPITATPGSLFTPIPGNVPLTNTTVFKSYLPQSRTVISPDYRGPQTDCQNAGVSAPFEDGRDHAFGLLIRGVGRGGILGYMIAADAVEDNTEGRGTQPSQVNEDGFNIIPGEGCPQHIDGTTPPYVIGDQPRRFVDTPVLPTFGLPDIYQAPV